MKQVTVTHRHAHSETTAFETPDKYFGVSLHFTSTNRVPREYEERGIAREKWIGENVEPISQAQRVTEGRLSWHDLQTYGRWNRAARDGTDGSATTCSLHGLL